MRKYASIAVAARMPCAQASTGSAPVIAPRSHSSFISFSLWVMMTMVCCASRRMRSCLNSCSVS